MAEEEAEKEKQAEEKKALISHINKLNLVDCQTLALESYNAEKKVWEKMKVAELRKFLIGKL